MNLNITGLSLTPSKILTTVALAGSDDAPAGVTASWTIDYYSGETCTSPCTATEADFALGEILNGNRSRAHSILFGTVADLQLSTLSDGSLRTFGHLDITDGTYHTVNDVNPNGDLANLTPAEIAGILFLTGIDVTDLDLTRVEFDSIYAFDITDTDGSDGTLLGGAGLPRIEFQSTSSFLAVVPEPATLAIFGLGLAGLGFARRRRAA